MLTTLFSIAFANSPLTASVDVTEAGASTRLDTTIHLGLDLTGWDPAVGARLDIGHRVAVEGRLVAGVPLADGLTWTGGTTLGVHIAPVHMKLGSSGSVDVRLGTGLRAHAKLGGESKGPWSLGSWLSSTLEVSPDGRWALFGGVVADDAGQVVPTAGVRVRLTEREER